MIVSRFRKLKNWQKLAVGAGVLIFGIGVLVGMITGIVEITNRPKESPTARSSPVPSTSSTPASIVEKAVESKARRDPDQACQFLAQFEGLQTHGYRSFSENDYSCLSYLLRLGDDFPLPNSITYFANGDSEQVKELELHLNVNVRSKAKAAHDSLLTYSQELTKRALNTSLPENIKAAIRSGKAGNWQLEDASIALERDNWPTGKGYSLDFYIR